MNTIIEKAKALYALDGYEFLQVPGHEGGLPDDEDIEEEADCLIRDIPYGGFGEA